MGVGYITLCNHIIVSKKKNSFVLIEIRYVIYRILFFFLLFFYVVAFVPFAARCLKKYQAFLFFLFNNKFEPINSEEKKKVVISG